MYEQGRRHPKEKQMKILLVSHDKVGISSVVTMVDQNGNYETHLFNSEKGHTELHNTADNMEDAMKNHRLLCIKCYIRVNV